MASTEAWVAVEYTDKDLDASFSSASSTKIALNGSSAIVTGTGATASGSTVTIRSAGTFVISGTLSNGQIVVDAGESDDVRLVLNGAGITNASGPAILVNAADKVFLILPDGTQSTVADTAAAAAATAAAGQSAPSTARTAGSAASTAGSASAAPVADDVFNAVIYSKSDLVISGQGSLTVDAKAAHGIVSKDDLKIISGTIAIDTVVDGLKGKDLVAIKDGNVTIMAKGDGIQATHADDTARGHVVIEGGTVTITAAEDAINSVNGIAIKGGSVTITADDDGLHADTRIVITGGSVDIRKSYEGIESSSIDVYGGTIRLVASDDGFNVNGGADGSSFNGRPGQNSFSSVASGSLSIHGGTIVVNASGDGLDSNGSMAMAGGTVVVNGPTANNNGALDYNGTFTMTGGTLIAAGSTGMAQAPGPTSTQNALLVSFPSALAAGTLVSVRSSTGEEILSFAPAKTFQSIVIATPNLKKGSTYTVSTGGTVTGKAIDGLYAGGISSGGTVAATLTISSVVTSFGSTGGMGMGGRK